MRPLVSLLIALFLAPAPLAAQRKKKPSPIITDYAAVRDSIAVYNFDAAIDLLDEDIAARIKKRKPTDEAEQLLDLAHKRQAKLMATERVMIVDSVIVDKQQVLRAIPLSRETGSQHAMREMLNKPDTADCTMFRNQLDNFSVFAQPAAGGRLMLFQTELIGDEWTKPAPLRGITTADAPADFNYPFMLTDGTTLYFAARGEESLGGYDIYMTRYDADEQAYLEPENIGMPFNSPANDYLFAIDEFYNLGWFATDRGMAPGKVCVYTFIPNATRRIYNEDDTGSERLRRLARITSIAETWSDQAQVAEARKRMEALSAAQSTGTGKRQFTFVLSDRKTCHSESDFQNAEARQMVKTWQEHSNNLQATRQQLAQLRDKYAAANEAQRAQMAAQIRLTETDYEQLLAQVRQIEKSIRAKELGK